MTLQLPAHLQGRQSRNIADKASIGLGTSLPPHISIRGNTFTLVDAAGNEAAFGPTLDIVVVDSSELPIKRYYDKPWTPGSNDPPLCFSANGVAPSREAVQPQSRTCAECPKNERGSAVSKISGAAIKACRDEKWLAVLLPQYPTMLFQLVVTPGSFKNWTSYTKNFGTDVDISDVVTRVTFQAQVNGVLMFEILGYAQNNPQFISNDVLKVLETAWSEKKTIDTLVGRNDKPIMLAAPVEQVQQPAPFVAPPAGQAMATPGFGQSPSPSGTLMIPNTAAPAGGVTGAFPSEQPQRRKRRTAAEMQAAQAPNPTGAAAPFVPQQPAPFQPAGNGAAPAANFGMQAGATPDPALTQTLEGLFGKK